MSIPQPSITANFIRTPNFLDPKISFSRASNATYVGKNGLIVTSTTDQPRFEYSSSNGVHLGLLSEEQRINYILQSENFSTTWSATDVTVSNNSATAPDGNFTGDLLTEGLANTALVTQAVTVATTNLGAGSVFLKVVPNTGVTWVKLFVSGAGSANGAAAWFDLSNGAIGSNSVIGGGSQPIAVIDSFNDGWYRCRVSANCPGETSLSLSFHSASADGSNTRVNGASYYAWGGQLENGRLATSYIPTTTATATRAAERMAIEGANFNSVYNTQALAGTLIFNINFPPEFALDDTSRDVVGISIANAFTRSTFLNQGNATSYWTVGSAGVVGTGVTAGQNIIGMTYSTASNSVRAFRNGVVSGSEDTYDRNITANTAGVNAAADVILLSQTSTLFANDRVYYRVPNGNTAIGGLSNNSYYYISFVNSTAFALASTLGGANIDLTEARTTNPGETHTIALNLMATPYDRIYIGSLWAFSTTSGLNGHFKKFAYYQNTMSNTQMQYLTSIQGRMIMFDYFIKEKTQEAWISNAVLDNILTKGGDGKYCSVYNIDEVGDIPGVTGYHVNIRSSRSIEFKNLTIIPAPTTPKRVWL